ncbi:MAG: hypothetical protein ACXVBO_10960, partial [Isosphaeraceae bacterium]
ITHQLRPINMNGRSILSETSTLGLDGRADDFFFPRSIAHLATVTIQRFPYFAIMHAFRPTSTDSRKYRALFTSIRAGRLLRACNKRGWQWIDSCCQ